ncbi:MAG: DNA mismatch repair endonuclease MutL [Bacteroidaceae bacterium]|nr:DNA mismatch repair endonuclease MutL [Bacteroidaceae bacterium]
MDDIIHLLPDSVANQIAAGEVVQRPSSIIKEMVENSIDADAKNIQVLVVDGGKTNVQIIDDGKGMSETDARLSFERHATSKIKNAADLFNLSTMGFRGEALASIAAVAYVELTTRRHDDELGTFIQIAGSKIEKQEPVACPEGSNFSVKNLFYNVPARRKFLRGNQTELTNVIQEFERIVLVHPDISFTLYNNGSEMYHLPEASLKQRIVDVFGKKLKTELLPIAVETSLVSISGYVAKPEASKKKGAREFFFVNGRYMRHPYFHSAVMRAFDGLIPAGEHVSYFIYFSVDPSSIDVNVHPTKTEIKFDNEQPIWQVLSATIKETLGKFCNVPMIDFDVEGKPDIPVFSASSANQNVFSQPKQTVSSYNPFKENKERDLTSSSSRNWESLFSGVGQDEDPFDDLEPSSMNSNIDDENESLDDWDLDLVPSGGNNDTGELSQSVGNSSELNSMFDPSLPKFQFRGKYIVFPSNDGLMILDQHRAHIKILYEQNIKSLVLHNRPTQKVLFPEIVQFTVAEGSFVESMMADFTALGFELTNLGGASYSVSGVPSGIEGVNVDRLLHDMVQSAIEKTGDAIETARESLAFIMAKASAIVYGQVLSASEMTQIVTDLFALPTPARTPDGKMIYTLIDDKSIEKGF